MKYVIELNFPGGVHFGSDFAGYGVETIQGIAHSDTIFSAIINTLAAVRHEFSSSQWVKDFFRTNGKINEVHIPFKVSSFGFVDIRGSAHTYYIPKPLIFPENIKDKSQKLKYGKDFKQLKFISLDTFIIWQKSKPLDLEEIIKNENYRKSFWTEHVVTQHRTDSVNLATQVYRTGMTFYLDYIKPFFIIDIDEEQFPFKEFLKLIHVLKYNGLGGRRTSGCGIFNFSDENWFCIDIETIAEQKKINPSFPRKKSNALKNFNNIFKFSPFSHYLFSTYYPVNAALINPIAYDIVQRKGWIFSTSSCNQLKRKMCYMFSEGSIFTSQLDGKIVDVTPDEFNDHQVIRCGNPLTLPFCEVNKK
jgi:CRISPR-associated protein Csm4